MLSLPPSVRVFVATQPVKEPERITSPYAPDLGEVRAFLERMIHTLRFVELIAAIIAFITRVCEVNGELSKKLAELRRRRPRSESLERLERQLVLPLGDLGAVSATRPKRPPGREKKRLREQAGTATWARCHSTHVRVALPTDRPPSAGWPLAASDAAHGSRTCATRSLLGG